MIEHEGYWAIAVSNEKYNDLCPMSYGQRRCEPGRSEIAISNSYYVFHYVEKGKGALYTDDGVFPAKKGQMLIIKKGQRVQYLADESEPWEYDWFTFSGILAERVDALPNLIEEMPKQPFVMLNGLKNAEKAESASLVALSALALIMSELSFDKDARPKYVKRAKDIIDCLYGSAITVSGIAEKLNLDRSYLTRLFKEQMGKSVMEYLTEVRIEHAEEYLRQGISVALTATLVGYNDAFHFSRMFKKYRGQSPSEYAKRFS